MTFRISLLLILISGFVLSCSTGPEFERDSLHDIGAKVPNGKIISPANNSLRGKNEFNSFSLKFNKPALNKEFGFVLKSDKDGIIYKSDSITNDTIYIDQTLLTRNRHNIDLIINGKIVHKISIEVKLPDAVNLKSVSYNNFRIDLKWTKYTSDDFDSYQIYTIDSKLNKKYIKEINEISDTTFSHFNFQVIENLTYGIETNSTTNELKNQSNNISINTVLFISSNSNFVDNIYRIFYLNNASKLCFYDIIEEQVDCSTFNAFISSKYFNHHNYFNDEIDNPELIAFTENKIERFDLSNGHKIGEIEFLIKTRYTTTVYDPSFNRYYLSAGSGATFRGPYLLNWQTNSYKSIRYRPSSFDDMVIFPSKNKIFAKNINNLLMISYNNTGEFTDINDLSYSFNYSNYATQNSTRFFKSNNHHIVRNRNGDAVVVTVSPFETLFSLSSSEGYFINFYNPKSNQEYLIACTVNGTVFIYSLISGNLIHQYKFNNPVVTVFEYNNQLIALLKNGSKYSLSEIPVLLD